jgi:hypothetical protein
MINRWGIPSRDWWWLRFGDLRYRVELSLYYLW